MKFLRIKRPKRDVSGEPRDNFGRWVSTTGIVFRENPRNPPSKSSVEQAKEVLGNLPKYIVKYYKSHHVRITLSKNLKCSGVRIGSRSENAVGLYTGSTGRIRIFDETLSGYKASDIGSTLLHEMGHSIAVGSLTEKSLGWFSKFKEKVAGLSPYMQERLGYYTSAPGEFWAEMFALTYDTRNDSSVFCMPIAEARRLFSSFSDDMRKHYETFAVT